MARKYLFTGICLIMSLLMVVDHVIQPTMARQGRTYPPQAQKPCKVLLFPVYVAVRRSLYESIETHLSLADHSVSYLIYEEDYAEYDSSLPAVLSEDTHLIRRPTGADHDQSSSMNRTEWERSVLWNPDHRPIDSLPAAYLRHLSNRCEWLLNDGNLIKSLERMKLDLVIVELEGNDVCGLILARKLKVRAIGFSPSALPEPFLYYTGNPFFASAMPIATSENAMFTSVAGDLDLVTSWNRRASNLYSYVKMLMFWERNYFVDLARIACKHLDCPSIGELYNDFDLVFVNSDVIVAEFPRPLLPKIVSIGGIITKVPQLFPKDMEAIARSHRIGVILVTLETSLAIDDYPKAFINVLVDTLATFEHAIFWKTKNGTVENPSKNMFLEQVFSVQDILGHARTRLVITLCDTDTVHSAIFHGVPILCIPLLEDQVTLAHIVQSKGLGAALTLNRFNVESLTFDIQKIISNKTYRENVHRSSRLMRDRPETPSDRLIFWTEYVVRHGGAPHLQGRVTTDQYLFQYFLLDVLVVPVIAFLLLVIGIWLTIRWMTLLRMSKKENRNSVSSKNKSDNHRKSKCE